MNVHLLLGLIPYEGSTVLGAYASHEEAVDAAHVYEQNDRALVYPICYEYSIIVVALGAPAVGRELDGEEVVIDEDEDEDEDEG